MSIVLAVEILPIALLGIPSGALIAKLGARTTMVLGDAGRAPLMLAIPLLHEAGLLSFPLLLVCVFALGCFIAPYFSAQRLILPELVGDDEATVAQANAVRRGDATGDGPARSRPGRHPDRRHRCGERAVRRRRLLPHLVSDPRDARAAPPAGGRERRLPRPAGGNPLPLPRPAAPPAVGDGAVPEHVRTDAVGVAAGSRVRRLRPQLDGGGPLLRGVRRRIARRSRARAQARAALRSDPPRRGRDRRAHRSHPLARSAVTGRGRGRRAVHVSRSSGRS